MEEHLCGEDTNTFGFVHSVYKEARSLCLMNLCHYWKNRL